MKRQAEIVVRLFACATIDRYKQEILKINETWGKRAETKGVKVLFFLGEEKTDLTGDEYIYLPGVRNDVMSATDKQFFGLKYIYDNFDFNFVFICGTDTYINIDKLIHRLKDLNGDERHYIGGHNMTREFGPYSLTYRSGGGFLISKRCVEYLYPKLTLIKDEWLKICRGTGAGWLNAACDVSLSFYLHQNGFLDGYELVDEFYSFTGCNHKGYCKSIPCCVGKTKVNEIISCHGLSLEDFDELTEIFEKNNYFLV